MIKKKTGVKFDILTTYWKKERQTKTDYNIHNKLVQTNGGTGFKRDDNKTKFNISYKGDEIVESHRRQHL